MRADNNMALSVDVSNTRYILNVALSKPFYSPGEDVLGTVTCKPLVTTTATTTSAPLSTSGYDVHHTLAALSVQVHGHVFAPPIQLNRHLLSLIHI